MKLLPGLALCALALFQGCIGGPAPTLRHVSMLMPSYEERRAGATPTGGIVGHVVNGAPTLPAQTHVGPKVPQPEFAGVASAAKNGTDLFIHNGNDAILGQFPWMLAVNIDSMFFCGGSIISAEWVLTAGHCVDGASRFTMTAGSLASRSGSEPSKQVVTSTAGFRHPDYNALFIDNDIALIKPYTPFTFDGNYVNPVRLPSYSMAEDMMVGTSATLSGWGLTGDDQDSSISPVLKFASFVINDGKACYHYYGNVWIPTKICFDTRTDRKSSCQGDSGGPLIIQEADGKWTEIGLTSFGASAGCSIGLPIAFTRVASFLDFVSATTGIAIRDY